MLYSHTGQLLPKAMVGIPVDRFLCLNQYNIHYSLLFSALYHVYIIFLVFFAIIAQMKGCRLKFGSRTCSCLSMSVLKAPRAEVLLRHLSKDSV